MVPDFHRKKNGIFPTSEAQRPAHATAHRAATGAARAIAAPTLQFGALRGDVRFLQNFLQKHKEATKNQKTRTLR